MSQQEFMQIIKKDKSKWFTAKELEKKGCSNPCLAGQKLRSQEMVNFRYVDTKPKGSHKCYEYRWKK